MSIATLHHQPQHQLYSSICPRPPVSTHKHAQPQPSHHSHEEQPPTLKQRVRAPKEASDATHAPHERLEEVDEVQRLDPLPLPQLVHDHEVATAEAEDGVTRADLRPEHARVFEEARLVGVAVGLSVGQRWG
jgi:hypothetical protein